jgi:hypothetical protein
MHAKRWFATSCAASAASIRAWAVSSSSEEDCPCAELMCELCTEIASWTEAA